jgi:acetyl esterase
MKHTKLVSLVLLMLIAVPVLGQESVCSKLAGSAGVAPQPTNIEGANSYTYKSINGTDLRLHVFSDGTDSVQPAIVFFFGGGWNGGQVTAFKVQAEYFAKLGMRSVLVDYRTYCRQGVGVTDEIEDAKSAIRWIRSHAKELKIDPSKIAASGASSGGYLALSAAMFPDLDNRSENKKVSSKPNLLLLFYPCVDLTQESEMAYSSEVIGKHGHEASPALHIPKNLPPAIVFSGTKDPLYESDKQFCKNAAALGNQCQFIEYDGANHGYLNRRSENEKVWADDTFRNAEKFLNEAKYLRPRM